MGEAAEAEDVEVLRSTPRCVKKEKACEVLGGSAAVRAAAAETEAAEAVIVGVGLIWAKPMIHVF